jgi:glycosyltransferase involved in cell wall biosynthesis
VSILMLTHNAPDYVEISVRSVVAVTAGVRFELVVVDNASDPPTRALVQRLKDEGLIDRLVLSEENNLFAAGNNMAAEAASPAATHYLLLNSDIEARRPDWLRHLLDIHRRGITAYGMNDHPLRVNGYCLLIDADLYRDRGGLDVGHQWWWAVTKLQAQLLVAGYSVQGYAEHDDYLVHFGGKSGDAFRHAQGMNVTRDEVFGWFEGRRAVLLDAGPGVVMNTAATRRGWAARGLARLRRGWTAVVTRSG